MNLKPIFPELFHLILSKDSCFLHLIRGELHLIRVDLNLLLVMIRLSLILLIIIWLWRLDHSLLGLLCILVLYRVDGIPFKFLLHLFILFFPLILDTTILLLILYINCHSEEYIIEFLESLLSLVIRIIFLFFNNLNHIFIDLNLFLYELFSALSQADLVVQT
jgi:hypothetical protein